MNRGSFFQSRSSGSSQFWKGLHKVKHLFNWGAQHKVRDGRNTLFWHDYWTGEIHLRIKYSRLYDFCQNKHTNIGDCFDGEEWTISMNRSLTEDDLGSWEQLMDDLQSALPAREARGDIVSWKLENSGQFSTKSLYRFITHGGVIAKADTYGNARSRLKSKFSCGKSIMESWQPPPC